MLVNYILIVSTQIPPCRLCEACISSSPTARPTFDQIIDALERNYRGGQHVSCGGWLMDPGPQPCVRVTEARSNGSAQEESPAHSKEAHMSTVPTSGVVEAVHLSDSTSRIPAPAIIPPAERNRGDTGRGGVPHDAEPPSTNSADETRPPRPAIKRHYHCGRFDIFEESA